MGRVKEILLGTQNPVEAAEIFALGYKMGMDDNNSTQFRSVKEERYLRVKAECSGAVNKYLERMYEAADTYERKDLDGMDQVHKYKDGRSL